ncbi:MAG: MFS transporter [Actinomycetota bacterium]|nr:MFS transporter [Actinomycetota bacterium]
MAGNDSPRSPWLVIIVLATAQFVMVLDTTVMNVSISQVVKDLDTTVSQVQLAITAYTLVMAAFMLTGGKLGDMFGRRRIFSIGLAIYGVGSLVTALSPNITVLLVGWSFVEGLGATLVIPAIASLTAINYTGRQRAQAYGILGGIAAAGAAAGPLIGGFVTTELTWRVVFGAETVIVLGILLVARRIHDPHEARERPRLDVVGVLLSAVGLGLVVFGILKASEWGFLRPSGALTIGGTKITPFGFSAVPFVVAAGAVVVWLFFRWEERTEARGRVPLLRPALLGVQQLRSGLTMLSSQQLILMGTFFVIPVYLQVVLLKDALETGIAILPMSLTMIVAALGGSRLSDRFSPRRLVQVGLAVLFVGLIGLMATISPSLSSVEFGIAIGVFGFGIGLIVSQLGNVIMSSVDETRASEAGGLQGTAQNIGASLGTALIGAVLLTGLTSGFHDRIDANPAISQQTKQQVVAKTPNGVPVVSEPELRKALEQAGVSQTESDAIASDYADAELRALKTALLVASLMVFVALFVSRRLPGESLQAAAEPAAA